MRNVRRYYVPNAIVFITAVIRDRQTLFTHQPWVDLLFDTLRTTQARHPFRLFAYAILPDHLHWLMWTPPSLTFSKAMFAVKRNFTLNYKESLNRTDTLSLWQERFYDHLIRDEDDLWRHFDYIHYNPVKHGLVPQPEDWPSTSYRFWLDKGYYEPSWGYSEPGHIINMEGLE